MKKIVIAGVAAGIVAVVAAYLFVLPLLAGKSQAGTGNTGADIAKATPVALPGMMYPVPERVLNIASTEGTPHYARIALAIEFSRPKGAPAPHAASAAAPAASVVPLDPALQPVMDHKAQIDDAIVRIVGAKTMESLTSTGGKDALKEEVLDAVTQIVSSPQATSVYIVQLVVQ